MWKEMYVPFHETLPLIRTDLKRFEGLAHSCRGSPGLFHAPCDSAVKKMNCCPKRNPSIITYFVSLSCFMSFMSKKAHTHTYTHRLTQHSSAVKELWVGHRVKRSCNRRRQALFNIQLIWNLLVSPPSQPSQDSSRLDEKHFYWAFWEGQLPPCAYICVSVCVCVCGQKCVNQRGNPGVIRQDTASQQGAMIEHERANCRAEVWGVKSAPQGDLMFDIIVDMWVHHHRIVIPQGRSNMSATKTCVAYGRGLGPVKWVLLLCQNLRISERSCNSEKN